MSLFARRRGSPGRLAPVALDFQPDAVELQERPLKGSARWSLYTLTVMSVVAVLWASLSSMDKIVVARGRMVTVSPNIVVQPLETSIIRSIGVRVGQVVKPGEVMATLDPTFTQADAAQQQARYQGWSAQVRRLEAEIKGQPFLPRDAQNEEERLQVALFNDRKASYEAKLRGYRESVLRLEAALKTNQGEQTILKERAKRLKEIEQMRLTLYRNQHESRLRMLEAQNQRLEAERELEQIINREAEVRHELAKTQAERDAFVQGWRQELGDEVVKAVRERDAAQELLNKAAKRREMVELSSPVAAVVLEVAKRSVGSVVREAEPLVVLVPLDVPLEAEVMVEAKDIGFVREGDEVRVKFDAFPYQKHDTAKAVVRSISEDTMGQGGSRSAEQGQDKDREGGGIFFMARLTLTDVKLRQVPADFRIIPGMTVTGEIKVGRRSVISYLLYPIVRVFDESLREP